MQESDFKRMDGFFQELLDQCRISKLSDMEKEEYHKSILEYEDVQDSIAYAKECAAKEGMEKGMEKGLEVMRMAALKLLNKGMSVDEVVDVTGLSIDEVTTIANGMTR